MRYINDQELKSLFIKNEEQNLIYKEDKIIFNYDLTDSITGLSVSQNKEQIAYKFNIDNQEIYVSLDLYRDSVPSYMLLSTDSEKIISVLDSNEKVYSVNEEYKRISEISTKAIGGTINGKVYTKPFSSLSDFQDKFETEVENLKNTHIERYGKLFNSKMSEIVNLNKLNEVAEQDSDIANGLEKIIFNNRMFLSKLSGTFDTNLEKITSSIKKEFDIELEKNKIERNEKNQLDQEQKRLDLKKKSDLKEFVIVQESKDFLIEKFGYYPVVNFNIDSIDVSFLDKNDTLMDVINLKTIESEINFYSEQDNDNSYLHLKHVSDEEFSSLNKSIHKKYYHAIFDLQYGLIMSNKNDVKYLDEVVDKYFDSLPVDRDQNLFSDDSFTLAKSMKENYSSDARLEHVNKEINEKFKNKTRLKP